MKPSFSFAAFTILRPITASSRASSGLMLKPSAAASAITKLSPPKAVSTVMVPSPSTSSGTAMRSAKAGTFLSVIDCALPLRHCAVTSISPAGASSTSLVSGSTIGTIPASSSTVATQMQLEPDMGGVSSGSMMMKPIWARGSLGGTSRFTCRKTPPLGSFSTKARRLPSEATKRDCSQTVLPGGGATPPTITSPTSPSAWQPIT